MRRTIVNSSRDFADFNTIQYGHEDCRAGYSIGNFVRSNYLIHYVHHGKGIYKIGNETFSLSANDAFLIPPKVVTNYQADENDPWEYSWVEFGGAGVSQFLNSTPFSESYAIYNNRSAEKPFFDLVSKEYQNPYEMYSKLLGLLSCFITKKPYASSMADEYVKSAVNYINTFYYHTSITVDELSKYVGINRSYLCRIFKEKLGRSPKKYILDYKMKTAAKLLLETNLTIRQVARSTGFDDQLYFSTTFKSFYSVSPSKYKEKNKKTEGLK